MNPQQYDIPGLYQFLAHTPEAGLRKMLIDPKNFTDAHFNLMMKIIRGCDEGSFTQHFLNGDYPKVKMNANDIKLKDTFWQVCLTTCHSRGLLNPATKAA